MSMIVHVIHPCFQDNSGRFLGCCYRTRFDDLLPGPLAEGAVRRCTDDTDGLDVFDDDVPGRDLDAEIAEAGWKTIF